MAGIHNHRHPLVGEASLNRSNVIGPGTVTSLAPNPRS